MANSSTKMLGVHLGGTTCGVSQANRAGHPEKSVSIPTGEPGPTLEKIFAALAELGPTEDSLIGVACGDPIDFRKGIIQGPPNLPAWEDIRVTDQIREKFGCKAYLMNDANAGALAEWKFGAGQGCRNLLFLTFGTGMGAGMILDGRLYEGTTGSAGEVGHVRLAPEGPLGYGKEGSFEGFCSGGGIAQLAKAWAYERQGAVPFNPGSIEDITAKDVGEAALAGDDSAQEILRLSGEKLGAALALLVDILNPEKIILGSIYSRCRPYLEPAMRQVLEKEALARPLGVCEIVPSELDEAIGHYSALCVAPYRAGLWKDL
jgi:glucokinase